MNRSSRPLDYREKIKQLMKLRITGRKKNMDTSSSATLVPAPTFAIERNERSLKFLWCFGLSSPWGRYSRPWPLKVCLYLGAAKRNLKRRAITATTTQPGEKRPYSASRWHDHGLSASSLWFDLHAISRSSLNLAKWIFFSLLLRIPRPFLTFTVICTCNQRYYFRE